MSEFNKIINGNGWILLVFGLLASSMPLWWNVTGQVIDPLSTISILTVGIIFFLLGTYSLFYFIRGKDTKFLIKKGRHYSTPRFIRLFTGNSITAEVLLNKSMLYRTNNLNHINKLFGFSSGITHKKESARFGWRPNGGKIEIWSYVRHNWDKKMKLIGVWNTGDSLSLRIKEDDNGYNFYVSGGDREFVHTLVEVNKRKPLLRYMLWPYFGGEPKSVRNTAIYIQLL